MFAKVAECRERDESTLSGHLITTASLAFVWGTNPFEPRGALNLRNATPRRRFRSSRLMPMDRVLVKRFHMFAQYHGALWSQFNWADFGSSIKNTSVVLILKIMLSRRIYKKLKSADDGLCTICDYRIPVWWKRWGLKYCVFYFYNSNITKPSNFFIGFLNLQDYAS